jgi:hypothetical protein
MLFRGLLVFNLSARQLEVGYTLAEDYDKSRQCLDLLVR